MAVIEKSIRLVGSKGEKEVVIKPALAERLGRPEPLPEPMEFGTAKEGERVIAKERRHGE